MDRAITPSTIRRVVCATRDLQRRVHTVLLAILGAPNYDRYVALTAARTPHVAPMSRDEFARERLAARYNRPGARCC